MTEDEIAACEQRMRDAYERDIALGWKKIETAPKDGTVIRVQAPITGDDSIAEYVYWDDGWKALFPNQEIIINQFSLWIPSILFA